VFEDQTDEKWLEDIREGQKGTTSIRSKRIQEWNEEWELFCQWIVDEFGESKFT
jgi:adenosine deaminase CECR1